MLHRAEYFLNKLDALRRAILDVQSSQHVCQSDNTKTGSTTFSAFIVDVLPQLQLFSFDDCVFRVGFDLGDDCLDLLQFQVDEVIHQALSHLDQPCKQREVKLSMVAKGFIDEGQQVHY